MHSTVSLEPHAGHGTTGLPTQALFRFSSVPEPESEKRGTVRGTGSGSAPALAALPAKRTKSPPPSSPTLTPSYPGAAGVAAAAVEPVAPPAGNKRTDDLGTSPVVTGTGGPARARGAGSPTRAGARGGGDAVESRPVGVGRNGGNGDDRVGSPGGGLSPRARGAAAKGAAGKLSVRAVEAVETRDGRTVLVCLVSERELPSEVRHFLISCSSQNAFFYGCCPKRHCRVHVQLVTKT